MAANAATVCVGPAATGNGSGSDWSNLKAWSSTPARGDTWYLVNGTYSGKTFSVANSGTTLITIKKATVADHGGITTGWSDSLGNGQANFTSTISFNGSGYYVFDGQTGGGPLNWMSGFGFKISVTNKSNPVEGMYFYGSNSKFITVRHVEILGDGGEGSGGGSSHSNDATWIGQGAGNITISYGYFHEMGRCHFMMDQPGPTNLFEYIYCGWYESTGNEHAEIASWNTGTPQYNTVRYCVFAYIVSTGGFITTASHLEYYGNVFYRPAGAAPFSGQAAIGSWTGYNNSDVKIYNNSFINITDCQVIGFLGGNSGTVAYNNIFYSDYTGLETCQTHDYNCFASATGTMSETHGQSVSGNPFASTDPLSAGFAKLNANTSPGINLGAPYNVDMFGNTRTTWTRGAIEFGGSSAPVVSVSPSTLSFGSVTVGSSSSLTLTVKNAGSGTLSGTATVAAPFSIVSGGTYSLAAGQSQVVTVRYSPTAAGTQTQTLTLTGGGGASVSVSGTATTIANQPPVVSAISQNATDVDAGTPGLQVYAGTVVQYTGSASDPDGNALTWKWIYTLNGGSEITVLSGSGAVTPVSFSYTTNMSGSTFVWKLRVSDGTATSESTLTVGVIPPPQSTGSLTFSAIAGTITAPFVVSNGAISQAITTGVTDGGRAVYNFTITTAGKYAILATVNAPSLTGNSFYLNIDAEPQDPAMAWDINPVTSGFEQRLVSWRGNGTPEGNQYVPQIFTLTAGSHQLIIRGREANTFLQSLSILQVPPAPGNLHVVGTL